MRRNGPAGRLDHAGPSLDDYLNEVGPTPSWSPTASSSSTARRQLRQAADRAQPQFRQLGRRLPGFLILNTKKISGLSTQVKLYIYSHECGHQFKGADETKADLFAIRRGVKWGWLDAQGMEDICAFISQLKGDSVHPPGPKRCDIMRKHYQALIENERRRRRPPAPPPRPAHRPWDPRDSRWSEDPGDHQPEDHEE